MAIKGGGIAIVAVGLIGGWLLANQIEAWNPEHINTVSIGIALLLLWIALRERMKQTMPEGLGFNFLERLKKYAILYYFVIGLIIYLVMSFFCVNIPVFPNNVCKYFANEDDFRITSIRGWEILWKSSGAQSLKKGGTAYTPEGKKSYDNALDFYTNPSMSKKVRDYAHKKLTAKVPRKKYTWDIVFYPQGIPKPIQEIKPKKVPTKK